jgi:hypothetical protein
MPRMGCAWGQTENRFLLRSHDLMTDRVDC